MNFQRVGVLGSGIMGSGIAEVVAATGAEVIVRSRSQDSADAMLAVLERSLARQVERAKRTAEEADALRARVSATSSLHDLADCDLVIESVVEDIEVKRVLFNELDRAVRHDAILATNTSTLSVIELAMETSRPERVCGVHFFNPAPSMTLVEVVRPLCASDETIEMVTEFVRACGKDPVEVKDQAGFVVNALLFPYLNNAVRLLEQGVATKEGIDTAMKGGCGFPMGPFALLDLVGLDTSLAILNALYAEFADPNFAPAPLLRRMVSAGTLGRKSGSGFYDYRQ
ncbi:MAG TPA: 3-hydroxybutyryl-CoA dehydrogenase [Acidimicrobiales bacterium]|nr:3-hydroxybutyryl-CoA dehydrogenase [Acidimicrobiales bacterium]